jgi:isoquinoline 1-oxidoreductase beta subunit
MKTARDGGALNRRTFLQVSAAASASLMIALPLEGCSVQRAKPEPVTGSFGLFLAVHADGAVTVTVPVVEMGQGAQTALAMIIVDELGADWNRITVQPPPAAVGYQRPDVTKYQLTSGSWSVRLWNLPMRRAGAAAREMLIGAAAQRWGVAPESCDTVDGQVVHGPSGRKVGFGDVAPAAARLPVPSDPRLREPGRARLVGRPIPRTDIPSKVDGSGIFGVDVRLPGMLYATPRQAPVYGAEIADIDRDSAIKLRGVVDIVQSPGAVIVVADSFWHAKQALDQLTIRFRESPHDRETTERLMASERDKLGAREAAKFRRVGDAAAAAASASKVVSVDYTVPFLHHAPLEPMNCTARVTKTLCEVWAPTQCHTTALEAARRLTGLPDDRIVINATLLGGAFGRRIHDDFVEQAIRASMAVGRPVKLVWTREEDMRHGFHRPAMSARMQGSLDDKGQLTGLTMRIVGPSVHEKFWPSFFKDGLDASAIMALTTKNTAAGLHYAIAHQHIDYVHQPTHVPIGYWRSVGASHNGFFMEGFIDEVALAAGQDPAAFRSRLLRDSPRGLAVLDKAVEASGWGSPMPAGHGRGIAFCENVDSIVAQVAEVEVAGDLLRVHRIVAVVDCGKVINPDTVEAQMQGGIVNALSAALAEEITIKEGAAVQSNFHDYPVLRMAGSPSVDVHIIESGAAMGGVGEAMVPTLAPAVCNAIHAACGKRIRSLPIKHHGLRTA